MAAFLWVLNPQEPKPICEESTTRILQHKKRPQLPRNERHVY